MTIEIVESKLQKRIHLSKIVNFPIVMDDIRETVKSVERKIPFINRNDAIFQWVRQKQP